MLFRSNLLRAVDLFPAFYFLGGVVSLATRHNQRLGDLAANTVVVRIQDFAPPDFEQLFEDKFNSLRRHPHVEARLRQNTSPAEASLALQAVMRRDNLEPSKRVALFSELAAHFRQKTTFPSETVENVSDEQFVRNAVEALHRARGRKSAQPQSSRSDASEIGRAHV